MLVEKDVVLDLELASAISRNFRRSEGSDVRLRQPYGSVITFRGTGEMVLAT